MTKNNALVSIAIATYNGELYLANQLDSILKQTYKNIQIIIVDDASSDNTLSIIKQYQKAYSNISYVANPANMGIVKSFERAINLCQGAYIALSDQDDVWLANKIEKLVMSIGDSLLIHSDAILVNNNMQFIASSSFKFAKRDKYKTNFIDYLISNNVTGCTALFSRKLISLALPIPTGFYIHDHYLAIVASFYGKVKFLDEALIYYRQHANNSIGAKRPSFDKFLRQCKIVGDSYNVLLSMPIFRGNISIELIRDYRISLSLQKWSSRFSLLKLLTIKHGIKLIMYYLIFGGVFIRYTLSKRIYNYLYKI